LGRGLDRLGKSWSAVARRGQPLMISALRASALSAGFLGIQMWPYMAGYGPEGKGAIGCDADRQPLQTAALGASAPSAALFGE
jgi:hypothetical protein